MSARPSFLSTEVRRCPFDYYRALRSSEPVSYSPELDLFLVATYDLIVEVVKNPKVYSSKGPKEAGGARTKVNYSAKADEIVNTRGFGRSAPTLVNNDPPSHNTYRKLISETLRASRIRAMAGYVLEIVDSLLAPLANRTQFDAIREFGVPLPMYVIADQIGVERADLEKFKLWSEAFIYHFRPPKPESELIRDAELIVEAQQYIAKRMQERRKEPRDDIISELVNAKVEGGRSLSDREVMSMVEQLLVAGNETTTNGIGNGLYVLATRPALQAQLRSDPAKVPQFVEEVLRIESPVQGLVRTTTENTTLGGVTIPAGKTLLLLYASANRDEKHFDHSDALDLQRTNATDHMAFGSGRHHCVGSELARVEMRAAFEGFLRQFSHFELDTSVDNLKYGPAFTTRGILQLPLRATR